MVVFWISVSLMIAAALAFVLPPLVGRVRAQDASRDAMNLVIYHERRQDLEAEHAAGGLGNEQFEAACAELDRELLRDVDADSAAPTSATPRSPYPAIALAVALPLLAFGLYLKLGSPQVLVQGQGVPATAGGSTAPTAGADGELPHSVEEMVARLEQRMQANPEDPEGWMMLGRSYAAMNRLEDARRALTEANRRGPDNPLTMVALAEVLAGLQGNRLDGEPVRLVRRALEVEPSFARALWLAGVHAFNVGDRSEAQALWQQLLAVEGLSPEAAAQVRAALQQAGETAAAPETSPATPPADSAAAATAAGAASLSVSVTLAPELASRVDGSETLFVFARAESGPRMPLAIARHRASELPLTVVLDDSMAMAPQMTLSSFDRVVVSARVSRSGSASPARGDLQGASTPLSPGETEAVTLLIDQVVP
jgi:cytochrome c-type biogenesis protein CcmH